MSSREMPNVVCVRSLVPKLKNSASFGDLIGSQGSARQLDHGAHHVVDLVLLLREDLFGDAANDGRLVAHLFRWSR